MKSRTNNNHPFMEELRDAVHFFRNDPINCYLRGLFQ